MENPINPWMIWGENPPFKETSIYGLSTSGDIFIWPILPEVKAKPLALAQLRLVVNAFM